jgi:ribosome-binding factor A
MDERRTARVAETLREELAEIIAFEMEDPRVLAVDVSDVQVSPDGRYATVRVAIRGNEREQKQSLAALEHAKHFLRHQLAVRLTLRHVPDLHFEPDRHPDAESRVDFLLRRARKTRGRNEMA